MTLNTDLILFEERIRLNAARIQTATWRWKVFLVCLILSLLLASFLSLRVYLDASFTLRNRKTTPWQFVVLFLLAGLSFLFFVSGLFKQKLLHHSRFIAQCNRSLRIYNMQVDKSGQVRFSSKVPSLFQQGVQNYRQAFKNALLASSSKKKALARDKLPKRHH